MRWGTARIGVVVAGVLCGACLAVQADEAPYTLERCVELGLARSAAALNAERDREIGRALITQARSEAFPQLSGSAAYTRLDEVQEIGFGEASLPLGVLDNYTVEGRVEQLLYSGGRVRAALRAAGLARDFFDSGAVHTRSELTRDIRKGFHAILLAREAVAVRRDSVAQLEAHARDAEQQWRAGTLSEFDQLSARVRVSNERPALIAAQKEYAAALLGMRRILGVEARGFEVQGRLIHCPVTVSLADLMVRAIESRADVRQVELQVELNREQLDVVRAGHRPNLRAFFSYNGANAYQFVEYEDEWEWHWNAGLKADWTLWDGGLTSGRVRERRLELSKSETTLDDLVRLVRMQVQTAYMEMERAREAIAAGAGSVALARKALGIAKTRFDAGLATNLEYADSQLALRSARLSRWQALHDHMNAVAELEYVCGLSYGALSSAPADREEGDDDGS